MEVPVADIEFNLDDVTSLAQKLSNAKSALGLTPKEYDLLLLIFAAAAARAEVTDVEAGTSTLPNAKIMGETVGPGDPAVTSGDLQYQLLNAYIPGNYFQAVAPGQASTIGDQSPSAQAKKPAADEGGQ
jgi:hypothetical protein